MRRSVAFVNMSTCRAGVRGVPRVNRDHWHASQPCLVLDQGTELEERPAMQRGSLSATNRYPFADTAQVFESDPASGVFRSSHNAFADRVVGVGGKAVLFAGQILEAAARRLRAFALQFGAQAAVTAAHIVHSAAAINRPVAVSSNIDNAQVYAKEVAHVFDGRLVHFADLMQVERAAPVHQIRFALHVRQQGKLALARDERDGLPPADCPNAHGLRGQLPGQNSLVVGDTAVWSKHALPPFSRRLHARFRWVQRLPMIAGPRAS